MIDLFLERFQLDKEGEDSDADKHLENADCHWRSFRENCDEDRQANTKHVEDKEEFSKDISLCEAIVDNLNTGILFVEFDYTDSFSLIAVDNFGLVDWRNGDSGFYLLFEEIEYGEHHCEYSQEEE